MDYEIIIIGAGIVGLAIASEIAKKSKNVLLLERHSSFGFETSSRNSEVIHAGIYYPEDSLKAKFCVEGNKKIYEWCNRKSIPHLRIGKFIISSFEDDLPDLDRVYNQGMKNGVDGIEKIKSEKLNLIEPNINAISAIWSHNTGIVNSHELMQSFEVEALSYGTDIVYNNEVVEISKISGGYSLSIKDTNGYKTNISSEIVINSCGLNSDTIASLVGINIEEAGYKLQYSRGNYFRLIPSKRNIANHLIYPVPKINSTGLGIHLTVELSGDIKFGPDVEYLNSREQIYQVDPELKNKFYEAIHRYIPSINIEDIFPDQSGIRPKLQKNGDPFRDFIINEESDKDLPGFINLIGIESPGLTCSLEIAKYVKEMIY